MRMRSLITGLILSVISAYACGAQEAPDMDSRSSEIIKKGDDLFNQDEKTEALATYIMAADTALAEGNNSDLTEAYSQVARCYLSMDKKEEGRPWLDKAGKIASESEPEGWTRYLGVKGRYLWKDAAAEKHEVSPEVDAAARVFTDMYDYSMKHGLYNQAVDAANMMTIVSLVWVAAIFAMMIWGSTINPWKL